MSNPRSAKKRPSKAPARTGTRAKKRKKAAQRSGVRKLARLAALLAFLGALGLLGVVGVLSYYARDLPPLETVRNYQPPQITRIVDRSGTLIGEQFSERRTVVPMERIPRVLVLSVLAAEDADFYTHEGLDYAGIVRAVIRDLIRGKPAQGASTITQQLVKNVLLTPERTFARKIRELILARRLEQELSKDEILHLYLNHIYFGHGRYGVQEASRFYFGKNVEKLSLAEASLIAGIPKAPSRLSPKRQPEAAKRRQRYVLDQLEAKRAVYWDDLSQDEIDTARKVEVVLEQARDDLGGAAEMDVVARRLLERAVGESRSEHGGFVVKTTLDLNLQRAARRALREGLARIDKRQRRRAPFKAPKRKSKRKPKAVKKLRVGRTYDAVVAGADNGKGVLLLDVGGHRVQASVEQARRWNPKGLPPSEFAEVGARMRVSLLRMRDEGPPEVRLELGPQGAVVVLDPRTRDVLALVGGADNMYGFNRALDAIRQPGSTFKPIAYALALDSGKYTPATLVLDAPEVYDEWKPNNYETWSYAGAVRLREALARSINLVAVRVTSDLGADQVAMFAQKLGITTELEPNLALSLGASGVRPLELVNAYASFAAGGRYQPVRFVSSIEEAGGEAIELPSRPPPQEVMQPAAAYLITSMLQSVVQEGTGRAAAKIKRPAAGKTGTSNKARDAWFVGYTPEVVAGVWVGFDDHRPLGKKEGGSASALPIWIDVVQAAVGDRPAVEFPVPSDVETAEIDPESGLLAYEGMEEPLQEVFLAGTAPTERATPPDVLETDSFLMEQLGGLGPPVAPPPE